MIFDLDGVLVDSEELWDQARRDVVRSSGGRWHERATRAMMGMSSPEWAAYLRDALGVPLDAGEISRRVVARMEELYRDRLPLLPGAADAVRTLSARWPLGLASSANREIIDLVIELAGWTGAFAATVSSEEVPRGKPAPDVYLEVIARLGALPTRCIAVEDSSNGLRSAAAAGTAVIAVPNTHFPPDPDALALAAVTVDSVSLLTPELVSRLGT